MHKMKSFVSCAIALIIAAAAVLSVSASVEGVDSVYDSTSEYLCSGEAPSVGSIGGEWTVIGLARSGRITDSFAQGYYSNLAAYLKKAGKAQLDENKATENARVILALTAIKKDPSDVEGFNLFEPLSEMDFVTYQGINGAIWTLLAFDSYCYEIPISEEGKNQTTGWMTDPERRGILQTRPGKRRTPRAARLLRGKSPGHLENRKAFLKQTAGKRNPPFPDHEARPENRLLPMAPVFLPEKAHTAAQAIANEGTPVQEQGCETEPAPGREAPVSPRPEPFRKEARPPMGSH